MEVKKRHFQKEGFIMIKEKIKNAISIEESMKVDEFEELYIIKTRRKHDSGYYIIEVYGLKDGKVYTLTKCSDVIHFEKLINTYGFILSIDIPELPIIRIFGRGKAKIHIPFRNVSDFLIKLV